MRLLTDEEIEKLLGHFPANAGEWTDDDFFGYAKEIETAVLEKLKAQEITNESAYQRGYIDGKGSDTKRITELEAQNAKLVAALKDTLEMLEVYCGEYEQSTRNRARAALAQGDKT